MAEPVERSSPRSREWDLFDPDHDVPERLQAMAEAALERNARDGVVLDLRGLSDATDYFLVASGESDTHARSIAENVRDRLEEQGETPAGIEGREAGRWILLDYIDIVVHVFLPRVREYYQLESLWGDAPKASIGE